MLTTFLVLNENIDPVQLLKFTCKIENEGILNYLDVKIIRNGNKLDTTVYSKPNSTSEIIDNRCKTPYAYKIAALRAYINRAITVCSSSDLRNEEIKTITALAEKSGYNKKLIKQLYKARMKQLNKIEPGQKEKRNFTITIPFNKGASIKLKKETAKYRFCIPIKPNPSIFQRARSDKDKIEISETAGIYKFYQ